ncbi:hypothetical protein [Agarilytica rhodophyticola]|uniref:hypothetical protein n=1 Tax=Agarilytica rhodophyticola TaxID=1737490 RepID=UPI0013152720|nr:hypothetical protein [Agarilytica rhodophyticola]
MNKIRILNSLLSFLLMFICISVEAAKRSDKASHMNNAKLQSIIEKIDEKYQGRPGFWQLTIEGVGIQIVTDENADRMRIMAPILKVDNLNKEELLRLMQANFDSALDSRYAIANGILWGTFIHPLSSLTTKDFIMGLGQTVNVVISYGSTYSSGALVFGGGDSGELQRELMQRLKRLSDAI